MKSFKLFVYLLFSIFIFINCSQNNEKPSIKIDAPVLEKEYEANEIAADKKYKNQILEITGEISDISTGLFDEPIINFKNHSLMFIFPKDSKELLKLSKGMNVTIKGLCDGQTLSSIMLKECEIIHYETSTKKPNQKIKNSIDENLPNFCDCKTVLYREDGEFEASKRILGDKYYNDLIDAAQRECGLKYWDAIDKWSSEQKFSSGTPVDNALLFFYEKCKN